MNFGQIFCVLKFINRNELIAKPIPSFFKAKNYSNFIYYFEGIGIEERTP